MWHSNEIINQPWLQSTVLSITCEINFEKSPQCALFSMHDESQIWVLMIKRSGWTGFKLFGYWCKRVKQTFCCGLLLMTWADICTQLCARRDLGPPYIHHHSQRVMILVSQGEAAEGPDIFIFLLRSHSDLHTRAQTRAHTHSPGRRWPNLLIFIFNLRVSLMSTVQDIFIHLQIL